MLLLLPIISLLSVYHLMQVLSWQPRALYFPNFATAEQCETIIKIAKSNLKPSLLALREGETAESTKGTRTRYNCRLQLLFYSLCIIHMLDEWVYYFMFLKMINLDMGGTWFQRSFCKLVFFCLTGLIYPLHLPHSVFVCMQSFFLNNIFNCICIVSLPALGILRFVSASINFQKLACLCIKDLCINRLPQFCYFTHLATAQEHLLVRRKMKLESWTLLRKKLLGPLCFLELMERYVLLSNYCLYSCLT